MASSIMKVAAFLLAAAPVSSYDLVRRQAASNATYKDPHASVDDRVSDLLSRMTIEEKTAQLVQGDFSNWINTTSNAFNYTGLVWNMANRAGQFYVGYPVEQSWIAGGVQKAQDYLIKNTTLGIPAFVQTEGIHGLLIGNATIFNSPIAHACSWDPELIKEMARIIGEESKAIGVNHIFAPLADLARELRYGRVEETYGEDPHLVGEMAYNYVIGIQEKNVSATVKHFAGFSAPEQGLNTGPVHGGERELRTTWLPSFKRSIIDAGVYNIMGAYNSYDGIPTVADHHLMTDILRTEWGYKYWLTSDAGATDRLCCAFKMCTCKPIDSEAVTLYALPAGNDVEMGGGSYNFANIPKLVKTGKLDIKVVDEAVTRQLRAKFALGLFENPYPGLRSTNGTNGTFPAIHRPESVKFARKLDAESIVLLENRKQTLPLKRDANIAVIGPMADFVNFGDYVVYRSQYNPTNVNPLQGIKNASKGKVSYAKGCERWSNDESGFAEAVAAAEGADVAVVVVGTWSRDQQELWQGLNATTGEHVDVSSLKLVGAQSSLVKAIINTGKPTIVVFQSGKPVTEPWISDEAAALVQQFYPGEQGGNALADVLFGDVNPSGKLSVSVPHDVGMLPVFYDYLNSGRGLNPDAGRVEANGSLKFGHQYVLGTPVALYDFGYGLSYSNFTYSSLSLSKTTASAKDSITATVSITNTSPVDGKEVVQFYVQDVIASVAVPNKALKGFKKVLIKAGETVDVSVDLEVKDWGLWDLRMKYVVEPGKFVVWTGASSKDLRGNATVTIL